MAEYKYISDLTGEQLDAAFAKMANIDQYVSQAAVSANGAQSSASAASQSAAQASDSAATAGQQATAAAGSASNAADSAEQAQASASAASQSAQKAAESATGMSDFVQQAQASAQAAAQSASEAESSAGTAESAAQAAAGSEAFVSANAEKAEQAAITAATSEAAAQNSAAQAAGSASDAAASAKLIQDNLDAIQAAPGAAQAAQQAASDAQAAQAAAEDAAERAEQIADFDPADFATAEQGAKADSAVQSVNGVKPDGSGNVVLDITTGTVRSVNGNEPDGSGNVHLSAGDVGAATAAQGQKADSAVQTVNGQEPDTRGNVQITIPTAGVTSVNGKTGAVTLSAADVDAAQELLTGDITNVTPAQVREALQAGRQVILTVNSGDDILAAWVDNGTNVQCLYGWNVGTYANRPRAVSTDAYFGNPTGSNTWSYEKLYGNVLPEVTSADNGKTVVVQNGQWNLGTAGGGGEFTLIVNTGLTSWSENNSYNSFALYTGNYDAVGIEFYPNYVTDTDVFSPMQVFPIPENGQSRKYGVVCMDVNSSPMGEAQTRIIEIQNNGLSGVKITSVTGGYYYNWGNRGADDRCAVPARIYGIKY